MFQVGFTEHPEVVIIGSGNDFIPICHQAITWSSADLISVSFQSKYIIFIQENAFENVFMPDWTKPLPETNDLSPIGFLALRDDQFQRKCSWYQYCKVSLKSTLLKFLPHLTEANEWTQWGRDKMAAIFQRTFSNAFSWMKIYKFKLRFHWSLFPRVQLTIFQHWFRWWLVAGQATSHYLNQWWLVCWRIYVSFSLKS